MNETSYVVLALLIAAASVQSSIWETGEEPKTWLQKRIAFAERVPPSQVTAYKLQRFFIDDEPDDTSARRLFRRATDSKLGHSERLRRAASEVYYDVIFVVDASGSVKRDGFKMGLKALQILTSRAKPTTLYASVTFSEEALIEFPFKPSKAATALLPKLHFQGYRTNTQDALKKCRNDLFLNKTTGVREHSFKRVLIVTDGRSNVDKEFTLYRAYELKMLGVEVFVVAVGKYIEGIEEIIGMASSLERHLFRVDSLAGFARVVKLILPWPYRMKIRGS